MNCIIKKLLSQPSDRSPITLRCTGASLPPLLLKVRYNGIMDNLWWFVTLTSTQLSSIPPVTNGYDFVHNTQHKQETMHWVRYKDTGSGFVCGWLTPPPLRSVRMMKHRTEKSKALKCIVVHPHPLFCSISCSYLVGSFIQ